MINISPPRVLSDPEQELVTVTAPCRTSVLLEVDATVTPWSYCCFLAGRIRCPVPRKISNKLASHEVCHRHTESGEQLPFASPYPNLQQICTGRSCCPYPHTIGFLAVEVKWKRGLIHVCDGTLTPLTYALVKSANLTVLNFTVRLNLRSVSCYSQGNRKSVCKLAKPVLGYLERNGVVIIGVHAIWIKLTEDLSCTAMKPPRLGPKFDPRSVMLRQKLSQHGDAFPSLARRPSFRTR